MVLTLWLMAIVSSGVCSGYCQPDRSLSTTSFLLEPMDENTTSLRDSNSFTETVFTEFAISGNININYKDFMTYKILLFLAKYSIYITSVPGLVTNPLSIYAAKKIRPTTTSETHMFFLGIADLFVVSSRLVVQILREIEYGWASVECKMAYFITNTSYLYSNWILISWTLERFVAVMFPLKINIWCTVRAVKNYMPALLVLCCLSMIPQITEIQSVSSINGKKKICQYSTIYYSTYAMLENVVYMYIPMVVITGCNLTIILRIRQMSKERLCHTTSETIHNKRSREYKQMTAVLITVSGAFVFLHLPQVLAKVWEAVYSNMLELYQKSVTNYIQFVLYTTAGYVITDFQNSINFFFYCLFGSKVRKILLISCRQKTIKNKLSMAKTLKRFIYKHIPTNKTLAARTKTTKKKLIDIFACSSIHTIFIIRKDN